MVGRRWRGGLLQPLLAGWPVVLHLHANSACMSGVLQDGGYMTCNAGQCTSLSTVIRSIWGTCMLH